MTSTKRPEVLIVDDDREVCDAIHAIAERMDLSPLATHTIADALEASRTRDFEVALVDVRLPDGDGLELLPELKQRPAPPEVIIMTGFGDPDGAELAIRAGAWDYLEKPCSLKMIRLALNRALQYQKEKRRRAGHADLSREGIIGESPPLRHALDEVARCSGTDVNVLLFGETGTGKELFAWAIHHNSARAQEKFVVVDCTSLPADLVESVLLGHERGAFTGAERTQDGLVMQADGGTLFLDEVGELPLAIQKKFLRVLQERRFRRVGGKAELRSDFRLVAATNRNLDEMVERGEFREDLLYRLRAFSVFLPPLRERTADIPALVEHHLRALCSGTGLEPKEPSPDFFETLAAYDWPGNVRELNQALEQAVAAAGPDRTLFPRDLPVDIRAAIARSSVGESSVEDLVDAEATDAEQRQLTMSEMRERVLARAESRYLKELLSRTGGDIKEACRVADLSRSRLYSLLSKYDLASSQFRRKR